MLFCIYVFRKHHEGQRVKFEDSSDLVAPCWNDSSGGLVFVGRSGRSGQRCDESVLENGVISAIEACIVDKPHTACVIDGNVCNPNETRRTFRMLALAWDLFCVNNFFITIAWTGQEYAQRCTNDNGPHDDTKETGASYQVVCWLEVQKYITLFCIPRGTTIKSAYLSYCVVPRETHTVRKRKRRRTGNLPSPGRMGCHSEIKPDG